MLNSLKDLDPTLAAGILARTALHLKDNLTPNSSNIIENELDIRNDIINEICCTLNIDPTKLNAINLENILDYIDIEINSLIPETNSEQALYRLAERAELPTDLYEVNIIKNVSNFYGSKFDAEHKRILQTIKSPDREQHYGPPKDDEQPHLISLFIKHFPGNFPRNSFALLAVGQRNKLKITIHQVWRIYPDLFPNWQSTPLIDLLKDFSEKFGLDMEFGNRTGKFFLSETSTSNPAQSIKVITRIDKSGKSHKTQFTTSFFAQKSPKINIIQATLITTVDLIKYQNFLKSRDW